jgi:hypothetical protein
MTTMRAWSIRLFTLLGCAIAAGCGVSASATGLTPAFADIARDAHRYLKSDLVPAIGTARFPMTLAASRAKIKIGQLKVASEADKDVWLILTMVNVKSSELHNLTDMGGLNEVGGVLSRQSAVVQSAAQDVTGERDQCLAEAEGWLSGTAAKVAALKTGPCLRMVRQAAAILGK